MRFAHVARFLLVFLSGIFLGALVFGSLATRAQERIAVFVDEVPSTGRSVVTGSQVIGFSCVREEPPASEKNWSGAGSTTCYVASTR